ncbi:MAG: hypothetical protein KJ950_14195 [Proteobacteria bacterium]|nr:hypothetical protein [Pseudomonadota bacterium]MBU1685917.1 hypothetical protein [Pseudomonadota bacterium]
MNILSGLYFPLTVISDRGVRSFLALFDRIVLYQVSESDCAMHLPEQADGVELYCPLPMNDEEAGFLQMIKDLKGHAGEYYSGQLSSLSASGHGDHDDDQVWNLISSFRRDGKAEALSVVAKRLWQARMVLKLSEILSQEEVEVRRGYEVIRNREKDLFQALKGDDDDSDEMFPGEEVEGRLEGSPFKIGRVLKAWAQFACHDSGDRQILLTDQVETAELVLEELRELGSPVPEICRVRLPHTPNDSEWLEKTREMRQAIQGELIRWGEGGGGDPAPLRDLIETLNASSAGEGGQIVLYAVDGAVFSKVLARLTGQEEDVLSVTSMHPRLLGMLS